MLDNDQDGAGKQIHHILLQRFHEHRRLKFIVKTQRSVEHIKKHIAALKGEVVDHVDLDDIDHVCNSDGEFVLIVDSKFDEEQAKWIAKAISNRRIRLRKTSSNRTNNPMHTCVCILTHLLS
jgi:ribosome recycling factor